MGLEYKKNVAIAWKISYRASLRSCPLPMIKKQKKKAWSQVTTARVTRFAFFAGSVRSLSHIPSADFSPNQRTFTSIVAFLLSPAAFLPFLLISTTHFSLFSVSFVLTRGIPDIKSQSEKLVSAAGEGGGGLGAGVAGLQQAKQWNIYFPYSYDSHYHIPLLIFNFPSETTQVPSECWKLPHLLRPSHLLCQNLS